MGWGDTLTAGNKRPEDRFASAAELARALELALAGTLDDATRARGQRLELDGAWARRGG